MNLNHFSRFEQMAQQLFEGSFGRLFGSQLLPADIAARLAAVMEEEFQADPAGSRRASSFQVHLDPDDLETLRAGSSDLERQLTDYLVTLATQAEIPFSDRPEVRLIADAGVKRKQVSVRMVHRPSGREEVTGVTRTLAPEPDSLSLRKLEETEAFLIIDGKRHVQLGRPLITVGRQLDNDIILDAPSVSRQHAQLRWRYGRFVLYDLGSQYGTTVNGQPVVEHVLQAGDVIRLSTVSMVYGEDPVGRNGSHPARSQISMEDERPEGSGTTQRFTPGEKY